MPFASQQQARMAFARDMPWAKRWADETDFSKLPKRVKRIRAKAGLKGCSCDETTKEQIAPGITRIRGNLCNVHGKYGPCDAAAGGGKKPKGGKGKAPKAAKPKQTPEQRRQARQEATTAAQSANVDKTLTAVGMGDEAASTLLSLAAGEGGAGDDFGLIAKGLVERDTQGNLRLSGSGRTFLNAAKRGDLGAARDAVSRGGDAVAGQQERASARTAREQAAAQRKTEVAQRRAEAQQKREQAAAKKKPAASTGGGAAQPPGDKKQANRASVRQAMADQDAGLAPAGFDNLMNLSEGAEPDKQGSDALVSMGLAERGSDGTLRLTASARVAVNASNRGDTKGALDAISRARDRVQAQAARTEQQAARDATRGQQNAAREAQRTQQQAIADRRRAVAAARAESAAMGTGRRRKEMKRSTSDLHLDDGTIAHWDGQQWTAFKAGNPGDYLVVEDRNKPSTWHLQVRRNGTPDHGLMGGAWAALHGGYRGNKYAGPQKDAALSKLRALYASEKMPLPSEKDFTPSFTVYKDASGADRWISVSSTAYKDRDQEIVSTKALQGAVALADASGERGPLRFWHVPGVEIGDCDYQATAHDGRFLIESGTFRSPALAAAVKERGSAYQVSIGFTHPANEPDTNGVFSHIAIFERSLVPKGRASNPFTQIAIKESRMLTTEKADKLRELLGGDESLLAGLLGNVATTDKAAQDSGTSYKDDLRAIIREELAALLTTEKDDGDAVEAEPIEAQAETEELAGADTGGADENMLTPAELDAIADRVVTGLRAELTGQMKEFRGLVGAVVSQKDTALAEVKQELATVKAQVADLSGSQPRIMAGGFRASQAGATVTTDETKLKDAQPSADPVQASVAAFLADMGFGGPQQPTA